MKKVILSLFLAIMATIGLYAQQISVVSSGGSTSLYRTLQEAIEGADPGSVIYLPGGGFPIADSVKINKKLTIIGIGHYVKSGNVDGVTTISGNLYFHGGSSGSAVFGCYITGTIWIGNDNSSVNDILIKHCNVDYVKVHNNKSLGTVVNQNYIRSAVNSSTGTASEYASVEITNNIIKLIYDIDGGEISNNIITCQRSSSTNVYPLEKIKNSIITNNIILNSYSSGTSFVSCSSSSISGNMLFRNESSDNDSINLTGIDPNNVFKNYNKGVVNPASDFHFKDAYKQYESQVGVYADGVDFDKQLAPVPYIVAKHVDEQTDASGKLNIKIRVKAGQ